MSIFCYPWLSRICSISFSEKPIFEIANVYIFWLYRFDRFKYYQLNSYDYVLYHICIDVSSKQLSLTEIPVRHQRVRHWYNGGCWRPAESQPRKRPRRRHKASIDRYLCIHKSSNAKAVRMTSNPICLIWLLKVGIIMWIKQRKELLPSGQKTSLCIVYQSKILKCNHLLIRLHINTIIKSQYQLSLLTDLVFLTWEKMSSI